jgi:hypothetical protein
MKTTSYEGKQVFIGLDVTAPALSLRDRENVEKSASYNARSLRERAVERAVGADSREE